MHVCVPCVCRSPQASEDSYEPHVCAEKTPGTLQDQKVLLILIPPGTPCRESFPSHSARNGLTSYSVFQLLALSKAPNWQHHLENFWKRQILKYHFQKFHFISKTCTFFKTHHDFYVQLCVRTPSLLWSTVTFEGSLCVELSILSWLRLCLWGTFLT